jgi:hypothetical protein
MGGERDEGILSGEDERGIERSSVERLWARASATIHGWKSERSGIREPYYYEER